MKRINLLSKVIVIAILLMTIAYLPVISSGNIGGFNSNPIINNNYSVTNSNNANIENHKITASEFEKLKGTVGVYEEGKNYSQVVNQHGSGLRPPSEEEWTDIGQDAFFVDKITYGNIPSSVDWSATQWFPPIGNQGIQGSCVAWAVGYYVKTFQEAKEQSWNLSGATFVGGSLTSSYQNEIMSPAFVYNLINDGVDNGLSVYDAVQLLGSIGVSSWGQMPYNQSDYVSWPSEAAWTEAPYYRANSSSYQVMNLSSSLDNLKNWLASGNLAIISIDANKFPTFNNSDLWTLENYNPAILNHANTIVGYDDNFTYTESGNLTQGAFKIANSWGKSSSWEKTPVDGFYWISYEAMMHRVLTCYSYYDNIGYQPSLEAKFRIDHINRADCTVTVGLGTPTAQIITKKFGVSGGNYPFCPNNIVLDITEFKNQMPVFVNQPFFLKVYNTRTNATGSISYFSIENSIAPGLPCQTKQNQNVYANVTYSSIPTTLTVTPTSGPPSGIITLNGTGFTANNFVNISYLNPINATWIPIITYLPVTSSNNFTYTFNAPDLTQANPAGDTQPTFNNITFQAQDNGNSYSCNTTLPYTQWQRGLTSIGNAVATELYGNNTNFASTVYIQADEPLVVSGKWFNPGAATFLCDNSVNVGSAAVDGSGSFSATITLTSAISGGQHTIALNDGNSNFAFTITRLPIVTATYDGSWHTSNYNIILSAYGNNVNMYYRINGQLTQNVNDNGQPLITSEGSNNNLEYWGVYSVGESSSELTHKTLNGLKLDKTPPEGSPQINGGAPSTSSQNVTLNLTATDNLSGVKQVRFSNDGLWDTEQWETPVSSKNWILSDGNGNKTVYCQIQDYAGLNSTVNSSILLELPQPPVIPPSDSTSTIPEYPAYTNYMIALMMTVLLAIGIYRQKSSKKQTKHPWKEPLSL